LSDGEASPCDIVERSVGAGESTCAAAEQAQDAAVIMRKAQGAARKMQHPKCNRADAMRKMHHARCSRKDAAEKVQHATRKMQKTRYSLTRPYLRSS
jgi:hypothetical protein